MKKTITIFTGLVKINKNLVGTAVVYERLAYFLTQAGFQVNLVLPEVSDLKLTKINFYLYNETNNKKLIRQSQLVIFGAYPPVDPLKYAYRLKKKIITYLWSIAPIGSLEFRDFKDFEQQEKLYNFIVESYNLSLQYADKIFCRSQAVKDFVLGSLVSLGKANLTNYIQDRNFNNLISLAPFGIDSIPAKHHKNIYRNVIPGVTNKDFILIWNGGIWNWHDGISLVKIMNYIKQYNKNIKLIFQGFYNPDKIYSLQAQQTKKLADKLKLTNHNIFFPEKWISFAERDSYLTESNAGIVTSPNIPEANYFLKTRFYDYLWAELPIILNTYEAFAPEVSKYNLGLVLSGNYKQDAQAILNFVKNKKLQIKIKKNIIKYKQTLSWRQQLKPVIDYCKKI